MQLVHRRPCARALAATPSLGELFVACVVACMLLASLGDALDPALLGEAGLDLGLFDLGGETSVMAAHHWPLLELLLAGGVACGGMTALHALGWRAVKLLRARRGRAIDKVPI
jgi:hypothetical protein